MPVPVTVKLSNEFYQKLGDNVANELVNWFNQVDTGYRVEFKDLFEVHFSRFEARLDQRIGELDTKWERRFAELDAKWERRTAELDAKWEKRTAELEARWADRIGELKTSLILWMFGFWTATTFIMLGTTIAILKL